MSNQESEPDSIVSRIKQLQKRQEFLAKYIAGIKRRLDSINKQFNHQSEIHQVTLHDALAVWQSPLDERLVPPEALVDVANFYQGVASGIDKIQPPPIQVQSYEYRLVFERSGSRAVLLEALDNSQQRLIIVCPWLNGNSIDATLMQKLRNCLNRNCRIDIGWGYLSDCNQIDLSWQYDALAQLKQVEREYPDSFKLKLLGTHEKFLVCDSTFAMLGSHNLLTSGAQNTAREVGIRTTDPLIIQGLSNRFDSAQAKDAKAIEEALVRGYASLDDGEIIAAPDIDELA